jgi:hypothetical protein
VEGTDHNLWIEAPGWQQHGRTWVDGNVQAFAADPAAITGVTFDQSPGSGGSVTQLGSYPTVFEDGIDQTWQKIVQGSQLIHGQTFQQLVQTAVQQVAQGQGVTAYDISDSFTTQGSYSASLDTSSLDPTLHIVYYLGNNNLTFTTTTNSPLPSFTDPTFHVQFDMSIDVSLTFPSPLSSQSTVTASAVVSVGRWTVQSSNVLVWLENQFGNNIPKKIGDAISGYALNLSSLVDLGKLNEALQFEGALGYTDLSAGLDNTGNLVLKAQAPKFSFPGPIGVEYAATAHETDCCGRDVQALLGLPTSSQFEDVPAVPGALMQTFQGGTIYWSQAAGAHVVYGEIGAEYAATARETDYYGNDVQELLGMPLSDETNVPGVPGARKQTFQGGTIYWSQATGAHVVYGAIAAKYNSLGGPTSFLGLPTADESSIPGGRITFFQHGWILWTPQGGAIVG